jgi:DNA-binding response OmpR family regulator
MSLEGRTIALVEDDPIMGESLADRLSLEGARVLWWQSCEDAAANLETTMPDLVVCDIRLPDGSGEDVFRAACSVPDAAPFLFVTAYGEIEQAVRLMREGAGDYVTKPFEMASFLGRVKQLLRPARETGAPVLDGSVS